MSCCRACRCLKSKSLNVCSTSLKICSGGLGISTETVGTGSRNGVGVFGLLVAQPLVSSTQAIAQGHHLAALLVIVILGSFYGCGEAGDFPQGFAQAVGFLLGVRGLGFGMP